MNRRYRISKQIFKKPKKVIIFLSNKIIFTKPIKINLEPKTFGIIGTGTEPKPLLNYIEKSELELEPKF